MKKISVCFLAIYSFAIFCSYFENLKGHRKPASGPLVPLTEVQELSYNAAFAKYHQKQIENGSIQLLGQSIGQFLDGLPEEERLKALQTSFIFSNYVSYNTQSYLEDRTAHQRLTEVIARENRLDESNEQSTRWFGVLMILKADEIHRLSELNFDFGKISASMKEILLNMKKDSPELLALNKAFSVKQGSSLNHSEKDINLEGIESLGKTPKLISNWNNKFKKSNCFTDWVNDPLPENSIALCHNFNSFLGKILKNAKAQRISQWSETLPMKNCYLAPNVFIESNKKIVTNQEKDYLRSKSSHVRMISRNKDTGSLLRDDSGQFVYEGFVDFGEFFNFVSDICPGYVYFAKLIGKKIPGPTDQNNTHVYNLNLAQFRCLLTDISSCSPLVSDPRIPLDPSGQSTNTNEGGMPVSQ